MPNVGSDFCQRFQDKPPVVHSRMWDLQAGLIYHVVSEQHHVDIDFARTFLAHAETTHLGFDSQCQLEQFSRRHLGLDRGHAVQKPGLLGTCPEYRRAESRTSGDCQQRGPLSNGAQRRRAGWRHDLPGSTPVTNRRFGARISFAGKAYRNPEKITEAEYFRFAGFKKRSSGLRAQPAELRSYRGTPSLGVAGYLGYFHSSRLRVI